MNKLFVSIIPLITSCFILLLPTNMSVNASGGEGIEEDINVLILTANTPEDHMKIVEYYEKQAAKMEKMAKVHESMDAAYKKRSKPWPSMAKGCEKLTQEDTDAANEYKALAREMQPK